MRAESHTVFVKLAELRERHDLKAAGIGQNRTFPAAEFMQTTKTSNAFRTRTQHQMIGVAENDVGAQILHLIHIHGLDGSGCANWHEGRRTHHAARHGDFALTGCAITRKHFEFKIFAGHAVSLMNYAEKGNRFIASQEERSLHRNRSGSLSQLRAYKHPASSQSH